MAYPDEVVGQLDLASLRAAFPDWRVYRVSGNWHAFRSGTTMLDGPRSLLRCHIHADALLALADKLCLRAYLDGLCDQELAEVWHQVRLPEPNGQDGS